MQQQILPAYYASKVWRCPFPPARWECIKTRLTTMKYGWNAFKYFQQNHLGKTNMEPDTVLLVPKPSIFYLLWLQGWGHLLLPLRRCRTPKEVPSIHHFNKVEMSKCSSLCIIYIYNLLHINIYCSETSLFVISDGKGLGASQDNTSTPAVMANAALRPSRCTYHALKLKTGTPQ